MVAVKPDRCTRLPQELTTNWRSGVTSILKLTRIAQFQLVLQIRQTIPRFTGLQTDFPLRPKEFRMANTIGADFAGKERFVGIPEFLRRFPPLRHQVHLNSLRCGLPGRIRKFSSSRFSVF
jgi:hypothetical protein